MNGEGSFRHSNYTFYDYCSLMKFEYDSGKSAANREKHGIDFEEAQALWGDSHLIEAAANVTTDERRFLAVGMIEARHWTAVCTDRDGRVRIISVRRARKKEIAIYESERIRRAF